MNLVVDDIGYVVSLMRPLNALTYGADAASYITTNHPNGTIAEMPYYMYGHRLEIANRLKEKDQDATNKYKKYPLIALRMDFPEAMGVKGSFEVTLNIAILAYTDKKYNAEQRVANVVKPILIPLYDRFITCLRQSGIFTFTTSNMLYPQHTRIIRPFWGIDASERNEKYIFDDPLDAIEIVNLKLNKFIDC